MRRLFKEFIMTRTLAHVLFEREVKELWELFHSTWRDEHYDKPCREMTLRIFTGFIKKEGIIVAPARRKRLKFYKNTTKGVRFSIKKARALDNLTKERKKPDPNRLRSNIRQKPF